LYPSSSMARRTRSRVASLTGRYPLTTLDTVATETPARRAMSLRFTPATGSPDPLGTAEIGLHDDHHDEERAAGDRLVRRIERADLVDDVLDGAEQQDAAERTAGGAGAARQQRAADDDGGDRVEFHADAEDRHAGGQAGRVE